MNDTHICTRGKVWDLHIHSNQCYSTTDEELKKLSVNDYVARLIKVLEEYEDLDMISFTDHNQIWHRSLSCLLRRAQQDSASAGCRDRCGTR